MADRTNSGTCASKSYKAYSTASECFIQALSLNNENDFYFDLVFKNNQAEFAGSVLFGGLLDRCTLSPFSEVHVGSDPAGTDDIPPIKLRQIFGNFWAGNISGVSFTLTGYDSKVLLLYHQIRYVYVSVKTTSQNAAITHKQKW